MNDTVKTCPFCFDEISDDPDCWSTHVATYPNGLVGYTCQSCFQTFYVESDHVPAGALAASLVPA